MTFPFDWDLLSAEDRAIARAYLGAERDMDRRITYDGILWFARFNLAKVETGNVFFHIQTASDPVGVHTHPWDNTTVYLAGEVREWLWESVERPPSDMMANIHRRQPGQVVRRDASWAHRLMLESSPYCMTLFMTGPEYRHWGFWKDGASPPNGLICSNQ